MNVVHHTIRKAKASRKWWGQVSRSPEVSLRTAALPEGPLYRAFLNLHEARSLCVEGMLGQRLQCLRGGGRCSAKGGGGELDRDKESLLHRDEGKGWHPQSEA